jgi:two-component system, chemotaxis family, chemotaxis protein CheY
MARIVIFEDENALRDLLAELLEDEGHEVRVNADGRASADVAVVGDADLVVTDLMMPACDGLEVIGNIRRLNPAARIIAMSGGGRTLTLDLLPVAQEFGASRILRKPFMPDDFLAAVAAELGA